MRKFVLKVQTKDEVDITSLVGRVVEMPGGNRIGVEGVWELPADQAKTFVFVGEKVTQEVAKVHAVPGGAGYVIASSQPGERKPGLKATPVSQKDADRMRHILHNYDLLLSIATRGVELAEAVKGSVATGVLAEQAETLLKEYKG